MNQKISKKEKGFFAAADFYGGGGQALVGVLYYVFLLQVLKLEPLFAGAIVFICEMWDAFTDPIMGVIGDNFRSKFGRRKPFMVLGGLLLIVAFALLFFPISGIENQWGIFAIALIINIFYNTVSTIILVSYNSLSAEISADPKERDKANILRLVVSTAATAVCTLVPTLVKGMLKDGKITVWIFYLIVGVLFGLLFATPVILCGIFCKERTEIPTEKSKLNYRDFFEPLKVKPFRQLLMMYLCQAICMDIFSTGIILFTENVVVPEGKGSSTVFLGLFIAVQLMAFPLINKLVKNTDTNKIYGFGLPLSILAMTVFAICGQYLFVGYGCILFVAIGFAGAQLTSWIMYPHTVDAGELILKKRNSGSYSAIMTFARKFSTSIAAILFSIVLEFTGYVEQSEQEALVNPITQSDSAKLGIKLVMSITCIVFMTLGYFISRKYSLSKEVENKVDKFVNLQREGKLEDISSEEQVEYNELMAMIK